MTLEIGDLLELGQKIAQGYSHIDCAFISGSLVEGLGNVRSDLDVFVIASREASANGGQSQQFDVGDARIDITYTSEVRADTEIWSSDAIHDVSEELRATKLDDVAAILRIDMRRLELAHRIRIGMPVANPGAFTSIRDLFDYDHLARVLRNRFLARYHGIAEDAAGAIYAGDGGTALLTSREALGSAVDSYIAARGDTNPKTKWRVSKLRRLGDEEILSDYLSHELQESTETDALIHAAKRRVRAANQIAHRVQQGLGLPG